MKRAFIDCGAHTGNTLRVFKASADYTPSTLLFAFEPTPRFANVLRKVPDCHVIPKAVWVVDGTVEFFYDVRRSGLRSTAVANANSHRVSKEPALVPCIDFGQWIRDSFRPDDQLVVKMDIEGAEYAVLRKMFRDGSIRYVRKLHVEWHRRKANAGRREHRILEQRLKKLGSLELAPPLETQRVGYVNTFEGRRGRLVTRQES
jgi:FkbM family methyltransferase